MIQVRDRLLYVILFGSFWNKLSSLLSLPFITIFLYKNTDVPLVIIGFISGLQPLGFMLISITFGYLSDFYSKEKVTLCSIGISSSVFLAFYLLSNCSNTYLLVAGFSICSIVIGGSRAIFNIVSRSIVGDTITDKVKVRKFLHLRYFALNLGASIGPLIGAYAGISGQNKAFLITSILYAIYFCVIYIIFDNNTKINKNSYHNQRKLFNRKHLLTVLKDKQFFYLVLGVTLFSAVYIQLETNLAIVLDLSFDNGVLYFSWMLTLNAVMVIVFQPVIYKITKNFNQISVINFGYIIVLVSCLIISLMTFTMISAFIFVISISIAEIMVFTAESIVITEISDTANRGIYFGFSAISRIGTMVGPIIGGTILSFENPKLLFMACALIIGGSIIAHHKLT